MDPAAPEADADTLEEAPVEVPEAAGRLVLAPETAGLEAEAEPEAEPDATAESPAAAPSARGVVVVAAPSVGAAASALSTPPGALVAIAASPSAGEL